MKLTDKRDIHKLTILFSTVYMISYITRINFAAIISEMESGTEISRSLLSMSLTGSFITYGIGQIVSGFCGDRFSPKKLITYGLSVSTLMNLLIPICKNPYQMLFVWCINGFAQSFMWPPLAKLMTVFLSDEEYKTASTMVSWGSAVGTMVIYLISPLLISVWNWKCVFLFSALCGIVMIFVWAKSPFDSDEKIEKEVNPAKPPIKIFTPAMIGIFVVITLKGMMKEGVVTWMPSYISDTYNIKSSLSILTGVVLPVFSMLSFFVANRLYIKFFKNPVTCATVFFAVGTLFASLLCIFSGRSAAMSVLSSAMLTGALHGANLMLTCMLLPFFNKSGNVSTVSGLLNAFTYAGSAISSYGIAVISENIGWNQTLYMWLLMTLLATVLCFVCAKPLIRRLQ